MQSARGVSSFLSACKAGSRKNPSERYFAHAEKGLPESEPTSVFVDRECTKRSVHQVKLHNALREHLYGALVLCAQRALVVRTRLFQSFKEFAESHNTARRDDQAKIPEYHGANLPSTGENCTRLRRRPVRDPKGKLSGVFHATREGNARAVVELGEQTSDDSKNEDAKSPAKSLAGSGTALKDEGTVRTWWVVRVHAEVVVVFHTPRPH